MQWTMGISELFVFKKESADYTPARCKPNTDLKRLINYETFGMMQTPLRASRCDAIPQHATATTVDQRKEIPRGQRRGDGDVVIAAG